MLDRFISNYQYVFIKWVIKKEGRIEKDSLAIYSDKNYVSGKKEIYDFPQEYKFYETDQIPEHKPTAWYLKKKWYQEGLHESRK